MDSLNNYLQEYYKEEPLPEKQEDNEIDPHANTIKGVKGLTAAAILLSSLTPSCQYHHSCPPCLYRSQVDGKMHSVSRKRYFATKKEFKKFLKEEDRRRWLENLYIRYLKNVNRVEGIYLMLLSSHRCRKPSEAQLREYDNIRKYLEEVKRRLGNIKKNFPNYYYIFNVLGLKVDGLLNNATRIVKGKAPCPSSPKPCTPRKTDEHIL